MRGTGLLIAGAFLGGLGFTWAIPNKQTTARQ
jgi:hypothetical protein